MSYSWKDDSPLRSDNEMVPSVVLNLISLAKAGEEDWRPMHKYLDALTRKIEIGHVCSQTLHCSGEK